MKYRKTLLVTPAFKLGETPKPNTQGFSPAPFLLLTNQTRTRAAKPNLSQKRIAAPIVTPAFKLGVIPLRYSRGFSPAYPNLQPLKTPDTPVQKSLSDDALPVF